MVDAVPQQRVQSQLPKRIVDGILAIMKVLGIMLLFILVTALVITFFLYFVTLDNAWLLIPASFGFFGLRLDWPS